MGGRSSRERRSGRERIASREGTPPQLRTARVPRADTSANGAHTSSPSSSVGSSSPKLSRVDLAPAPADVPSSPLLESTRVAGRSDASTKQQLQLLKATAHEVELEVPANKVVRAVHKAETLVRFSWLARPRGFLLLKKPGHTDITEALAMIGHHLTKTDA